MNEFIGNPFKDDRLVDKLAHFVDRDWIDPSKLPICSNQYEIK